MVVPLMFVPTLVIVIHDLEPLGTPFTFCPLQYGHDTRELQILSLWSNFGDLCSTLVFKQTNRTLFTQPSIL